MSGWLLLLTPDVSLNMMSHWSYVFSPWKHFHPVSCFCDSLIGVYVLQSVSHNLLLFSPHFLFPFQIFFFNLGNNGGLGAKALGRSWNTIGSATPLAAWDALATYISASLETRWLLVVWHSADGFKFYKNSIYCSLNCFCKGVALHILSLSLHFFKRQLKKIDPSSPHSLLCNALRMPFILTVFSWEIKVIPQWLWPFTKPWGFVQLAVPVTWLLWRLSLCSHIPLNYGP